MRVPRPIAAVLAALAFATLATAAPAAEVAGTANGFCCVAVVTVNGAQSIEGRWRVSAGTGTMYVRGLTLLKVA